jgi:hypothetical protein
MFFPFLAASLISAMLIQLGALSVWVIVLKAMLLIAIPVAVFACMLLAWRWKKDAGPHL